MFREEQIRDIVAPKIATLAIITASLIMGPLIFALVAVTIVGTPDFSQLSKEQPDLLALISIAMAIGNLVLATTLPRIMASFQRGQIDPKSRLEFKIERLSQTYHTSTIIAAGLFEGAAFLGVIAYQIEGSLIGLCVGIVMMCCIACLFPTPGRAVAWIERQLQLLEEDGDLRSSF